MHNTPVILDIVWLKRLAHEREWMFETPQYNSFKTEAFPI